MSPATKTPGMLVSILPASPILSRPTIRSPQSLIGPRSALKPMFTRMASTSILVSVLFLLS